MWCQSGNVSWNAIAMNLCKPLKPLQPTGDNVKNWSFEEQLQWFLVGTESSDKSGIAKIGIVLLHAGN